MKSLYCSHCEAYVGDCGHMPGGYTGPSTISGTCGECQQPYRVTCKGDCLDQKEESEKAGPRTTELRVSDDGRAILDSDGNEVARFREGLVLRLPVKYAHKLPGHMVCRKECIAWDANGNCTKYIQSCTWEFPPFDF